MSQTSATDTSSAAKRPSRKAIAPEAPAVEGQPASGPPPIDATARRRTLVTMHLGFLLVSIGIIVAAALLRVNDHGQVSPPWGGESAGMPPLCVFKRTFDIDCPGCGLTRCFVSVAHGDVAQAWAYHPVGMIMFVIVVAQLPYRSMQLLRLWKGKPEIDTMTWAPWLAAAIGVLLVGQWIVRMII